MKRLILTTLLLMGSSFISSAFGQGYAVICIYADPISGYSGMLCGGVSAENHGSGQRRIPGIGNWVGSGDDQLDEAWVSSQAGTSISPEMRTHIQNVNQQLDYYSKLPDIKQDHLKIHKEFVSRLNSLSQGNFVSSEVNPTPIPKNVSPTFVRQEMSPLFEAIRQKDPLLGAERLAAFENQLYALSQCDTQDCKSQLKYFRQETSRLFYDYNGLLRDLPLVDNSVQNSMYLSTERYSDAGIAVRNGLNNALASRSLYNQYCLAHSKDESLPAGCDRVSEFNEFSQALENQYRIADQLSFFGQTKAYHELSEYLEVTSAALKGFVRGVVSGGAAIAAGAIAVSILPAEITVGAFAYVTYKAIESLVSLEQPLSEYIQTKWENFLSGTAEEQGAIIGEMTSMAIGALGGAKLQTQTDSLVSKAVEMFSSRRAVGNAVKAAEAAGAISKESASVIDAFSERWPNVTRDLIKNEGSVENLVTKTPEITKEAISGLKKIDQLGIDPFTDNAYANARSILIKGEKAESLITFNGEVEIAPITQVTKDAPTVTSEVLLENAKILGFNTQEKTLAFYTGPEGRAAAEKFVSESPQTRIMLEKTAGGSYLDSTNTEVFGKNGLNLWIEASKAYVDQANGEVYYFASHSRFGSTLIAAEDKLKSSIFKTVELESLLANNNVTKINVIICKERPKP